MNYLAIWGIYFISSFKEVFMKKSSTRIFILLLFSIITVFTGIRYYMGTDYHNYYLLFDTITDPKLNPDYEIGFLYIVASLKKIGLGPFEIFFFISMISFYFLKKGIDKNSKSTAMSLLIYFSIFMIPFNFNAVGQGIVVSIFIYSIGMMKRRETKKIILTTLIAYLIHTSGIMIFFSYLVYRIRMSMRQLLFISIISTSFIVLRSFILGFLVRILPTFISSRLLSYTTLFNEPVGIVSIAQRVLILGIIFLFAYNKLDENNRSLLQIYVCGFFLYMLFSGNHLFATRINLGFRVLEILLLPNIIFQMHKKENRLILILIIALLSIFVLVSNFSNPNVYPYKHIWG